MSGGGGGGDNRYSGLASQQNSKKEFQSQIGFYLLPPETGPGTGSGTGSDQGSTYCKTFSVVTDRSVH